jgi:ATP-binding cassette subfamily B protein
MNFATPDITDPTWRGRLRDLASSLRNLPRAFGLLWEADPYNTVGMAFVTVIAASLPVAGAWVGKLIIDGVLSSIRLGLGAEQGLRSILPYLGLEFGFILVGAINNQARQLIDELIDHRLGHTINMKIIRKALSLEVKYFEDADFYDKMQNARRQSEYRAMALVNGAFLLFQNLLTLFSFLILLLSFHPWIAAVLFFTTIPAFIIQSRYSQLNFRLQTWRAPETRSMNYLEQLLTLDTTVKEVKLFGLGEPLLQRYGKMFWKIFDEDSALAKSRSLKSLLWGTIATLSYYGVYAWIVGVTVAQQITLGEMTLYLSLFKQSQGVFQGLLENLNRLYENGLFLENLFGFLHLPVVAQLLDPAQRPAEDPEKGIEFKNVWFQYPGKTEWALEDFSLVIRPREKLALVGENGAGKTTLIKLLTRLSAPTRGSIYYRGVDLRYFTEAELNIKIGAIFQDFVKYQLTLAENIGFGSIENLSDTDRIKSSAQKSGADEVAAGLPEHFATRLGRWFEEGHELSGGQWQKVALGRAFMRDAEVLILDEPTSALDAEAEYGIFQRFRALTENRIALLVSHRFSTVRMADRIAVIKGGKIEELGTHEELVARNGIYARLFELQAKGYR